MRGELTHLVLDIQRAFLFMEKFQGLDVAVSGFTLSLAWISAPFLINTSMIWMLPQPAAIRSGGVPCCDKQHNGAFSFIWQ
ncbi:hypothetical protein GOODEAATRI_027657, partial [Goodea atripinnis]